MIVEYLINYFFKNNLLIRLARLIYKKSNPKQMKWNCRKFGVLFQDLSFQRDFDDSIFSNSLENENEDLPFFHLKRFVC